MAFDNAWDHNWNRPRSKPIGSDTTMAEIVARLRNCENGVNDELDAIADRLEALDRERDARAERYETLAQTWKAMYDKAWAEIQEWRKMSGFYFTGQSGLHGWYAIVNSVPLQTGQPRGMDYADAHDAARKEAGLNGQ